MERVFWVKNGELETVNEWLQQGGRVKMIKPVSETISAYAYPASDVTSGAESGYYVGDIYAYIVIEFD